MFGMRRREFIMLLGGAAAWWPLVANAQQQAKLRTIGFLGAPEASTWSKEVNAFGRRLHELGWIEGRTVAIEQRWGEGRENRYTEIAAEFVRLNVDVIVTGGAATPAAKLATSVVPIVFAVASDPVSSGLVTNLARPGGNITGLSVQAPDLAGKRLELLREVLPRLRLLAIMAEVGYSSAASEMSEVEAVARTLGLSTRRLEIKRADAIASG